VVARHSVDGFDNTVNSLFVDRRKLSVCSFTANHVSFLTERSQDYGQAIRTKKERKKERKDYHHRKNAERNLSLIIVARRGFASISSSREAAQPPRTPRRLSTTTLDNPFLLAKGEAGLFFLLLSARHLPRHTFSAKWRAAVPTFFLLSLVSHFLPSCLRVLIAIQRGRRRSHPRILFAEGACLLSRE